MRALPPGKPQRGARVAGIQGPRDSKSSLSRSDKDVSRSGSAPLTQDGLIWPNHISDLRGWSSVATQRYGISSIPHAILIDKDGTVVATHLRGSAARGRTSSGCSEPPLLWPFTFASDLHLGAPDAAASRERERDVLGMARRGR